MEEPNNERAHSLVDLTAHESRIISDVLVEVRRQYEKWGVQNHDPLYWLGILMEEVGEAAKEVIDDPEGSHLSQKYLDEMIQVAAVAFSAMFSYHRNYERHMTESLRKRYAQEAKYVEENEKDGK